MVEFDELVRVFAFVEAVYKKIRYFYFVCDVLIFIRNDVVAPIVEEGYTPHICLHVVLPSDDGLTID